MADPTFLIYGRIRTASGQPGAGLSLAIRDETAASGPPLAVCLTGKDGIFAVRVGRRPSGAVAVSVLDRRGRVQGTLRPPGRGGDADHLDLGEVEFAQGGLPRRRPQPRFLAESGESLIDPRSVDDVATAWRMSAAAAGVDQPFPVESGLCPLPPMARMPGLLADARGVLGAHPASVAAMSDALSAMRLAYGPHPERSKILDDLGDRLTDQGYWKSVGQEIRTLAARLPAVRNDSVDRDGLLAVAFAAALLAGSDARAAHTNLGLIADQICGTVRFAGVARAARRVLAGAPLPVFDRAWQSWRDDPCDPPRPGAPGGPGDPGGRPGRPPTPPRCPIPWPPTPGNLPADPSILDHWECLSEIAAWFAGAGRTGTYTITSVVPARACPGETVTIRGSGFGPRAGGVRFTGRDGFSVAVTPAAWSDTRITAVVPSDASCGQVSLSIYESTIEVCGRRIDLYRGGAPGTFRGGNTRVSSFFIAHTGECVVPGGTLPISWRTCNADAVIVTVVDDTGAELVRRTDAEGSFTLTVPKYSENHTLTARIVATGPCGSDQRSSTYRVQRPYHLRVDGIEVTQAIQYYRAAEHLTDPADRGRDNSVPLVAGKGAWVRVYLRSGQDPGFDDGQLSNVSGTLTVARRVAGGWQPPQTLNPVSATPVVVEASYPGLDAERSDLAATLNFAIPANLVRDHLRLTVAVSSPDDCFGDVVRDTVEVDAVLRRRLRVAAVRIGYNGPGVDAAGNRVGNVTAPPPTRQQILTNDFSYALAAYPVSASASLVVVGGGTATVPLDGNLPAGGCVAGWGPIAGIVAAARANDQDRPGFLYYGFVTPGIPVPSNNTGCEAGEAAGISSNGPTLAHELGHFFGLDHAPCGNVGAVNDDYPLYEPYDTGVTTTDMNGNTIYRDASIGEYGLDIRDGTIRPPASSQDFMSYCGPRWVSLYTHRYLLEQDDLRTVQPGGDVGGNTLADVSGSDSGLQPRITLIGSIDADGRISVDRVARVATHPPRMAGVPTDLRAELFDDGRVVVAAPLFAERPHGGCGCGGGAGSSDPPAPPYAFRSVLDDKMLGSGLRIRRGEEVLWERRAPESPTTVDGVRVTVDGDVVRISWRVRGGAATEVDAWLRWSSDGGQTWHGLAVDVRGTSLDVPADEIPAKRARVQVLVHDGFATAAASSAEVTLPGAEAQLTIIHPTDGARLPADAAVHLWGCVDGEDERPLHWFVDAKAVGEGIDAWAPLAPGTHKVELRSPGLQTARCTVEVVT